MKAFIFGSNGQDGYYLENYLKDEGIKVIGISRNNANYEGDIVDLKFVERLIAEEKPDYIFNFAANSTTSHDALWENHSTICTGSLNILESCLKHSRHSKIFLPGSALQFENKGLPIDENSPLAANSPYAVCRNHTLFAARYYRELGLQVYFGFFFNHDSPIRPNRHVAQRIASYCKNIKEQTEKLQIGSTEVKKEWTFAGDVVEAVWIMVNQNEIFECIIGSGKAYSILDWIKVCFNLINEDWENHVEKIEGFKPEYDILISNPKNIFSLGWEPNITFVKLAKMMVK